MRDYGDWSRREFLRRSLLASGALAAPGLLGGCGALGLGGTLEEIKDKRVVKIGFADERPFSYREGGRLVGAIAAVHRVIFDRIGEIELQGVLTPFQGLLDGLDAGNFDVEAAGMFIRSERCERAEFSSPIYCAKSALLVRRDNPRGLTDYRSVEAKRATLAVLAGAVEEDYAGAAGIAGSRLRQVGTQRDGLELVASGEVDAFTLTSVSLRALVRQAREAPGEDLPGAEESQRDLTARVELAAPFVPIVDGKPMLGCGGAAFRKTDDDLRDAFNAELDGLRRDGTLLELLTPYGFTEAELPDPGVTTEELCESSGITTAVPGPVPR